MSKVVIGNSLIISFVILERNRIFCLFWYSKWWIINLEKELMIKINSFYFINFNDFSIKSFFVSSSIYNIFFIII